MQARRSMMTNNIVRSIRFTPILNIQSRFYSLERPEIETRIYGVLRAFSRVCVKMLNYLSIVLFFN